SNSCGSGPRSSPPFSSDVSASRTCRPIASCTATAPAAALEVRTARGLSMRPRSSSIDTESAWPESSDHEHPAHDRNVLHEVDLLHLRLRCRNVPEIVEDRRDHDQEHHES